jgi:hypothetical protein
VREDGYQKWLVGCGIGCAAVLVLVVAIGLGGYFVAKRTVEDFKEIAATVSKVDEQYGAVDRFTPEPDGRIPADRMEAFLAVRAATSALRAELQSQVGDLEHQIGGFEKRETGGGFWNVIRTVRNGVGVIPKIAHFHGQRAEALLKNQMGLGEYTYLYIVVYYSWLKKDPGDGPRYLRLSENHTANWDPKNDPQDAREARRLHGVQEVRRIVTAMLQNARERGGVSSAGEIRQWDRVVEAELLALESEWGRLPWEDGLPKEIQDSLEPYRAELENAYDPLTNSLELMQLEHR